MMLSYPISIDTFVPLLVLLVNISGLMSELWRRILSFLPLKLFLEALGISISSLLSVLILEACRLELMLLLPKSRYIVFEFFFLSKISASLFFNGYQVTKVLYFFNSSASVTLLSNIWGSSSKDLFCFFSVVSVSSLTILQSYLKVWLRGGCFCLVVKLSLIIWRWFRLFFCETVLAFLFWSYNLIISLCIVAMILSLS